MNIFLQLFQKNAFLLVLLLIVLGEQLLIAVGSPVDQPLHIAVLTVLSRLPIWLLALTAYQKCLLGISESKISPVFKKMAGAMAGAGFMCFLYLIVFSWGFYVQSGMFISQDLLLFGLRNFFQLQLHLLQTGMITLLLMTIGVIAVSGVTGLTLLTCSGRHFYWNIWIKIAGGLGVFSGMVLYFAFYPVLAEKTHPVYSYLFTNQEYSTNSYRDLTPDQLKDHLQTRVEPDYSTYHVTTPVIVIMIESMRSDLVNINPDPIPFMKRLAEKSIYFTKPYATASHSDYADLSVWYSQYPLRQRRRTPYSEISKWRGDSIFKVFKELGYSTAYISSQNEKWGDMIDWLDVPEVDYFFDSEDYDGKTWYNRDDPTGVQKLMNKRIATAGKIEDTATLNIAKQWISSLESSDSFFLGINLQNSHFCYVIPEGGPEPFQPSVLDFPTPYMFWPEEKILHVKNRYLNAMYNIDILIRDFALFLHKKGIWDNCIFVIIGDSGEAFYEHGTGNHGAEMYEEVMRTFSIIKPPNGNPAQTIDYPISHIDILPTVLDLLGVPNPATFQGKSALASDARETVYLHSNGIVRQYGLIRWPWKLLYGTLPRSLELFHLEDDPDEKNNLALSKLHEPLLAKLLDTLDRWVAYQLTYYAKKELYEKYSPPSF